MRASVAKCTSSQPIYPSSIQLDIVDMEICQPGVDIMPVALNVRKLKELYLRAPCRTSVSFAYLISARAALIEPAFHPILLLKIRRHIAGKRISPDGIQFPFTLSNCGTTDFAYVNFDFDPEPASRCALIVDSFFCIDLPRDLASEFAIIYADGQGAHVKLGSVRKNADTWQLETASKQLEIAPAAAGLPMTEKLVFIGGPAKSGTTWVERCLNGHPDLLMTGENSFFDWPRKERFAALLESNGLRTFQTLMPSYDRTIYLATFYAGFAERILHQYASAFQISLIGDKTPTNALAARLILQIWPQALYIHCNRHPLDVCVSRYFHERLLARDSPHLSVLARDAQAQVLSDEGRSHEPGWMFCNHQILQLFLDIWISSNCQMRVVRQLYPERTWVISYEDMLEREADVIRETLRFIGVGSSSFHVDTCLKAGSFERLSGNRPRGDIDESSFFRRGEANTYGQYLSAEQVEWAMAYLDAKYPFLAADGYASTLTCSSKSAQCW
ncbi:MAG TPA: sulfotransferase [Aestuariivirgaceae bacterium]|nr:sulfotransferase [Aestuariivirgaceae bacterium]